MACCASSRLGPHRLSNLARQSGSKSINANAVAASMAAKNPLFFMEDAVIFSPNQKQSKRVA